MNTYKKIATKLKSILLILILATAQVVTATGPFITQKASAAGLITFGAQFENQTFANDPNTWTNGQLDNYSEGDYVNFRFQLNATDVTGAGSMFIEFDLSSCNFFTNYFELVSTTPNIASVEKGTQSLINPNGNNNDYYKQNLDVAFSSVGLTTVIFTLQLSNTAGECSGSNTGVRLGVPSQGAGDIANAGSKTLPMSANSVLQNPSLTITKTVTSGDADEDEFYFTISPSINGQTEFHIPDGQTSVTINEVNPDGQFVITEHGPNGYIFTSGSGPNCVVNNSTIGTPSGVMTATLTAHASTPIDATCNFTNAQQNGSLKVLKNVINDNGGIKTYLNFTFKNNLGDPISFDADVNDANNEDGVKTLSLPVGTQFSITEVESNQDGYSTTYSGTCTGTITVSLQTCTITNNDNPPILHLRKVVTNDNGGTATTANFTLTANGTGTNDISGTSPVDSGATLLADTFALSETNPGGYSASAWVCTGNGTQNGANITLGLGQEATCTITNNDIAPVLQLIKSVLNDNGGSLLPSAWTLTATGALDPSTDLSGTSGVTSSTDFKADTYTLGESFLPGYSSTGTWNCTGGGTYDDINKTITLALAENVICTITNNDNAPTLTVVKNVVNDNGGNNTVGAFGITMNTGALTFGTGVVAGSTTAYTSTPTVSSNTDYTLSESDVAGYAEGTWSCDDGTNGTGLNVTVNLSEGENVICTITNNDIAPVLTLNKIVVSTNEDHQASDWTLTATPTTGTAMSGNGSVTEQAVANITYTLSELNISDGTFDASAWTCNNGVTVTNSQIILSEGAEVTCTITNTERATVVVTKYNDFNRDGNKDENEPTLEGWEMLLEHFKNGDTGPVGQTTLSDGKTIFTNVAPGSYGLSENLESQPEWNFSNIDCDITGERDSGLDGQTYYFSTEPGQTINCFVGNYREPVLLLEKSNNRPAPTTVGDTVTYTLVVTVPDDSGAVFDTSVQDLPPEGFNYVPGSWTASVTHADNSTENLSVPEPTYGSPGTWLLGTLLPGDVVTLTYKTLIASTASAGIYPDLAFANGCNSPVDTDCEVFFAQVPAGSTFPFTGTTVSIRSPQVLGASTTVLVNTGHNLWQTIIVGTSLLLIALATLVRRNKKGAQL